MSEVGLQTIFNYNVLKNFNCEYLQYLGCGVGIINETYGLLLSLLFTEKRALAHSIVHISGILGIVISPLVVEYIIASLSWFQVQLLLIRKSAMADGHVFRNYYFINVIKRVFLYLVLSFLMFGCCLLIAVPYPFNIVALDRTRAPVGNRMRDQKNSIRAAFNFGLYKKEYPRVKYLTIFDAIGDRK